MNKTTIAAEPLYTFRELNAGDLFLMCKVISGIGLNRFADSLNKDSIKALFTGQTGESDATTGGIAMVLEITNLVMAHLPYCKEDFFRLLSAVSNLTMEQVEAMKPADFVQMVIDFIRKPEFADFLPVAAKLFK